MKCSVEDCDRPVHVVKRGLCNAHYQRWAKHGDPLSHGTGRPDMFQAPEARFWAKVEKTEDCWTWTGNTYWDGYGQFWLNSKMIRAHRYAYELMHGPVPEGMLLDHACHNADPNCGGGIGCSHRRCVNPDHLEPVTNKENLARARRKVNQ